ncbi:MAG: hypothetical protein ACE5Q3_16215, partial [Alphaproteobacteria bacterium]
MDQAQVLYGCLAISALNLVILLYVLFRTENVARGLNRLRNRAAHIQQDVFELRKASELNTVYLRTVSEKLEDLYSLREAEKILNELK